MVATEGGEQILLVAGGPEDEVVGEGDGERVEGVALGLITTHIGRGGIVAVGVVGEWDSGSIGGCGGCSCRHLCVVISPFVGIDRNFWSHALGFGIRAIGANRASDVGGVVIHRGGAIFFHDAGRGELTVGIADGAAIPDADFDAGAIETVGSCAIADETGSGGDGCVDILRGAVDRAVAIEGVEDRNLVAGTIDALWDAKALGLRQDGFVARLFHLGQAGHDEFANDGVGHVDMLQNVGWRLGIGKASSELIGCRFGV